MSTEVESAIGDLLAVPGLRGLLLLDSASVPRMYRLDHEVSRESVDSMARGISQVVRRIGDSAVRIELRYEKGRFYIQTLNDGLVVAILTDARPNLPLLFLSLETLVKVAASDRSKVLETFRASELLRLRAMVRGPEESPAGSHRAPRPSDDVASPAEALPPDSHAAAEAPADNAFALPSVPPRLASVRSSRPLAEAEAEARSITTSRGVGASRSNGHAANGHLADGHAAASVTGAARASRGAGTHGALAATLTRISATAAQHLGRSVIANYWRQCQREEAVEIFEARQDGSIRALSFDAPASASTVAVASAWARSFVARCALIVVDIEDGLVASLDDEAQALIGAAASEGRVA